MAVAQILDENKEYIDQKFIEGLETTTNTLALGNDAKAAHENQIILQSGGDHTIQAPQIHGFFVDPVRDSNTATGLVDVRYHPSTSEFRIISGTENALIHESGTVHLPNLPTSDPGVAGQVWNNSGVLNISSG